MTWQGTKHSFIKILQKLCQLFSVCKDELHKSFQKKALLLTLVVVCSKVTNPVPRTSLVYTDGYNPVVHLI